MKRSLLVLALVLQAGCAGLLPKAPTLATLYSLEGSSSGRATTPPASGSADLPAAMTLIVNTPRAAPGFDSQRMVYVEGVHTHAFFSHSEWLDTPANMLAPLIVGALKGTGAFGAVVAAPSVAAGKLRLDTDSVQLEQIFGGRRGRVRFRLSAYLIDAGTRQVIASGDFEDSVATQSEDPPGGVVAANQAVRGVLDQLATFCANAFLAWKETTAQSADLP